VEQPVVNLKVLRRSRKRLAAGDIFAMFPLDGRYLFGRVISTTAKAGPSMPANLIYIFDTRSASKRIPTGPELGVGCLLIAPLMTNRLGWSRGYFETIANRPLGEDEVLRHHCFESSRGRYYDEMSRPLEVRTEPCGIWGLDSYRSIDDAISKALGIPFAPD
jgi:immunity protein 26 of polymorphic toxin system